MAEFSTRPGWEDTLPIPQDDGPEPVCAIAYTEEYIEVMDLFRAVLKANEMSHRAFMLTAEVVDMNPANYTAWEFRRRCLKALKLDLQSELQYTQEMAEDNPKNYQIWFHRRAVVELHGVPSKEMDFVNGILTEDMKNYHAWSYRQWVLRTFGNTCKMWEPELESINNMLKLDHYNNSAWNQRWFVVCFMELSPVSEEDPPPPFLPENIVQREIDFALSWIEKDVTNESPWTYIRGLMRVRAPNPAMTTFREPPTDIGVEGNWRFSSFPGLVTKMIELRNGGGANSVPLLGLLLEAYESKLSAARVTSADEYTETLERAREICDHLAAVDSIRRMYWARRKSSLMVEDTANAAVAAVDGSMNANKEAIGKASEENEKGASSSEKVRSGTSAAGHAPQGP